MIDGIMYGEIASQKPQEILRVMGAFLVTVGLLFAIVYVLLSAVPGVWLRSLHIPRLFAAVSSIAMGILFFGWGLYLRQNSSGTGVSGLPAVLALGYFLASLGMVLGGILLFRRSRLGSWVYFGAHALALGVAWSWIRAPHFETGVSVSQPSWLLGGLLLFLALMEVYVVALVTTWQHWVLRLDQVEAVPSREADLERSTELKSKGQGIAA